MDYLIYISTAKKLMTEQELTDILTVSRKNNAQKQVTGVLLYAEGTFLQLLEGRAEDIKTTYDIICGDDRHKNPLKLIEGQSENRLFPDWAMGFRTATPAQTASIHGYFDPNKSQFNEADKHPALIMIKTFAENNL